MAQTYKSYLFRDKDPVIDQLRTLVEDSGLHWNEVAERSGVSPRTLYNWFQGDTLRPKFCTANAVARALGAGFVLAKTARPVHKLRAVK